MAFFGTPIHQNTMQLQATLASASSGVGNEIRPHHPIQCSTGDLVFNEDNSFECNHARVEANDPRTKACIIHSLVFVLLDPAINSPEWRYKTPDQLRYEWFEKHGEEWEDSGRYGL